MTDEMLPIFGKVPDYLLRLKKPVKGQFQPNKSISRWQLALEEVSKFTGEKSYPKLAKKLQPLAKKPEWILDFIKQAKTGREPIKLFWWLIKENVK